MKGLAWLKQQIWKLRDFTVSQGGDPLISRREVLGLVGQVEQELQEKSYHNWVIQNARNLCERFNERSIRAISLSQVLQYFIEKEFLEK